MLRSAANERRITGRCGGTRPLPMRLSTRPLTRGSSPALSRLRGIGIFPGLPKLEAAFVVAELAIGLIGICLFVHFSRELNRFTDARLLEGGGIGGPAIILA